MDTSHQTDERKGEAGVQISPPPKAPGSSPGRLTHLIAGLPRPYWYLWLGALVSALGGFVIPFLALYLTGERGLSAGEAALMLSLFGVGAFAASLLGGQLADRFGRRPILLVCFLGGPIFIIALGLARSIAAIAALILLVGLFSRLSRPTVGAAVADLVPAEERPRAYGYLYWGVNIGFAIAPAVAGLIARRAYLLLFLGDALTMFLCGLIVLCGVPETRPVGADRPRQSRAPWQGTGRGSSSSFDWAQHRLMLLFTLLALGFGVIWMQGNVTLPMDMQAKGMGPDQYGFAIAVNGALVVLLGVPASHAAPRWPLFKAMAVSTFLLGAGFGLTAISNSLPLYSLAIAVWTLGEIGGATIAPAIVADLSPPELRGLYQGVFHAAWSGLASFAGPLVGGLIFAGPGARVLWASCFILGCLLALAYWMMAGSANRHIARMPAGVEG